MVYGVPGSCKGAGWVFRSPVGGGQVGGLFFRCVLLEVGPRRCVF